MADTAKFALEFQDRFSAKAKKARKEALALQKGLGLVVDQQGRWRHANGRFANANELAAVGLRKQGAALDFTSGKLGKFARAFKYAAGVAAVAAVAAGAMVYQIGRSAVASDATIMALDKLTHHKGAQRFQEIGSMAASLGLDIDKTRRSYANFLKLQFNDSEAKKMISLGADMQALGNSADDIQGIFRALGQIKSKGRLQGEELLQLAERGVSQGLVYEALAKNRGMTGSKTENVAKLQGMQQAGEISSEEFFVAFEEAINKKLAQTKIGESAKEFAAKTMAGQLNRIKEKAKLGFETLSRVAGEGMKTGLGKAIDILEAFGKSKEGKKILEGLIAGFKSFGEFLNLALPLMAEAGTMLVQGLGEGFGFFSDALNMSAASGETWTAFFRDTLVPAMKGVGQIIGFVAGSFVMGAKVIGYAVAGIGTVFRGWQIFFEELVPKAWQWGSDIISGLINGISSGIGRLWAKAQEMGDTVKGGLNSVLSFGSPSKVMTKYGKWTGEGFQKGMDHTMPDVGQRLPSLSSVGAAGSSAGGGGRSISVGDIVIQVSGSGDPQATAQATWSTFRRNMDAWLSQTSGEMGAA